MYGKEVTNFAKGDKCPAGGKTHTHMVPNKTYFSTETTHIFHISA